MIFGADIPFATQCGIEEIGAAEGRTRLRLVVRPEHGNNLGIAHGGLICTLLDVAMGTAARTQLGVPVMTLDMQARFLAPGRGVLIGEGQVVRAGRSVVFCEAEVTEEGGELVARGSGLFKPVRERGPG
jgi:uncharacterized protein (TIGR00369 family)